MVPFMGEIDSNLAGFISFDCTFTCSRVDDKKVGTVGRCQLANAREFHGSEMTTKPIIPVLWVRLQTFEHKQPEYTNNLITWTLNLTDEMWLYLLQGTTLPKPSRLLS